MKRGFGAGVVLGLGGYLLIGGLFDPNMKARNHNFIVTCAACVVLGGLVGYYLTNRGRKDEFEESADRLAKILMGEDDDS